MAAAVRSGASKTSQEARLVTLGQAQLWRCWGLCCSIAQSMLTSQCWRAELQHLPCFLSNVPFPCAPILIPHYPGRHSLTGCGKADSAQKGPIPRCSLVAGVQPTHLTHAFLNDHCPLHAVHSQVHASMQAQVNHQHLPEGTAGMSMLQPKPPASQLSSALAKQWTGILILLTADATAPMRPQSFLGLDCHIRQN